MTDEITEKDIEKRAHEIYQRRRLSAISGNDISDWLQAKSDLEQEWKLRENITSGEVGQ